MTSCFIPFPRILTTPVPAITGTVIENKSGRPIKNATVQFKGLRRTSTSTDSKGRFTTRETKNTQFTMIDTFYVSQNLTLMAESPDHDGSTIEVTRYGKLSMWSYSETSPTLRLKKQQAEQVVAPDR
jgi:hypothetical protein